MAIGAAAGGNSQDTRRLESGRNTPRTCYIKTKLLEHLALYMRARASSDAFRETYKHIPEAQDPVLAMPYQYSYMRMLEVPMWGMDYGIMIERNKKGMQLQSDYVGQKTFEYLEGLSEKHPDIVPPSCLEGGSRMIDLACGAAGALRASQSEDKAGIDNNSSMINCAVDWSLETGDMGQIFDTDMTQITRENAEFGNADFIHWGAPVIEFSGKNFHEKCNRAEQFMRAAHNLMDLDNPEARLFIGLPMNAISVGEVLADDTKKISCQDKPFVKALHKYFDILDVSEAGDREDLTDGRLVGDAFSYGLVLKPKNLNTINITGKKRTSDIEQLPYLDASKRFKELS